MELPAYFSAPDSANNEIVAFPEKSLERIEEEGLFSVPQPLTNEVLLFDDNDRHVATKSLLTDSILVSFGHDDEDRLVKVVVAPSFASFPSVK